MSAIKTILKCIIYFYGFIFIGSFVFGLVWCFVEDTVMHSAAYANRCSEIMPATHIQKGHKWR